MGRSQTHSLRPMSSKMATVQPLLIPLPLSQVPNGITPQTTRLPTLMSTLMSARLRRSKKRVLDQRLATTTTHKRSSFWQRQTSIGVAFRSLVTCLVVTCSAFLIPTPLYCPVLSVSYRLVLWLTSSSFSFLVVLFHSLLTPLVFVF